jgi:hypothetical protein
VGEDSALRLPCSIATVGATIKNTRVPGSEVEYLCYANSGTRGAPVIDATSPHHVIAMDTGFHSGDACMMDGTEMRYICEDAGSLLNCQ